MRYVDTVAEANRFDLGIMAVITILLTTVNITMHARSECLCTTPSSVPYLSRSIDYYRPLQQRQIIRILLLPPVFATISFFSYRYFRDYTYYRLAETVYEALAVSAFLMLLIQYVGGSTVEKSLPLTSRNMPIPFCCWRYRPNKPYFMHTLKVSWRSDGGDMRLTFLQWAVLQYCLFSPLITIAGIVTEKYNVLCKYSLFMTWGGWGGIFWQVRTGPHQYSVHFAAVYLDSAKYVLAQSLFSTQHWRISSFVSFSVALYALLVFYTLTKEDLEGRQPLAKFLSIKFIVFFTFCKRRQFITGFFLRAHRIKRSRNFVQYLAKSRCHQGYDLLDCDKRRRWSASIVYMYWGIQLL